MPAIDFPEGWKFCGVQQSKDPRMTGMQVVEARKLFGGSPGTLSEIVLQAQTREKLVLLAEDYERLIAQVPAESPMTILADVARINKQLCDQVTSLQRHSTLQEEQLRAYRRVEFSEEQHKLLKTDLEETTTRVLKSYGMEPKHEVPLPRLAVSSVAVNGA